MRIFVDTNVLPLDGSLDALELTTLLALAAEHGHRLVLPSTVMVEAEAQRLAKAQTAFGQLHRAVLAARRFAPIESPSVPTAEETAADFRAALGRRFDVAPLPPGAAEEALRRDAFKLPPAHGKGGARDAAIWLTIKWEHVNSADESAFVTHNRTDFSDPANASVLHPVLREELGDHARRFLYYGSADALVIALASPTECDLDAEAIGRSPAVQEAIEQAMIGLASSNRWSYQLAEPAVLKNVTKSRCFNLQSHVLAILSTIWEVGGLAADRQLATLATLTMQFRGTVSVHLWLRFGLDGPGEPVAAGLHSVGMAEMEYFFGTSEPTSSTVLSQSVFGAFAPTVLNQPYGTVGPTIGATLPVASASTKTIWTPRGWPDSVHDPEPATDGEEGQQAPLDQPTDENADSDYR
jgi:hypothetical protein